VEEALERGAPGGHPIGAVVVEPVQGRAGVRIPPAGFLAKLGERARARGALVVADEVLTGMGRTGDPLRSVAEGLVPDLVSVGKALGGGLPVSACLGPSRVMDAWPPSPGEALHTSTFLGHPLGCAAALAVLDLIGEGLPERVTRLGERLAAGLRSILGEAPGVGEIRGAGLLLGIELVSAKGAALEGGAVRVAEAALAEGLMVLPGGELGHVVELAPSAFLTEEQVEIAVRGLGAVVARVAGGR
jgi:4-aminobutyrate aminotransferase-like enzyme